MFSATAVDGKGRPVTDLRREEFRVYEEGRPQPIAHFHDGTRACPARVLLLVDASGSMTEECKVASARRAARQILDALGPEDQVALAGFDSRYWGVVAVHPRPRGGPARARRRSPRSARPRSTTPSTRPRATSRATARAAGRWWC